MNFLKTRGCAVLVLAAAVVGGTLFGAHRSLTAQADKITAQNEYVMKDLNTRVAVGSNFYTVASRYLPEDAPSMTALRDALDSLSEDVAAPEGQEALRRALDGISSLPGGLDELTEKDAEYVSGFQAQLRSVEDTLSRDPYNELAEQFNTETLGGFPASVLGKLTGVDALPVYH